MASGVCSSWSHCVRSHKEKEMNAGAQLLLSCLFSPGSRPQDAATYTQGGLFPLLKPL